MTRSPDFRAGRMAMLLAAMALLLAIPTRLQAGWQLTWSDEFTGTTINTNNWIFETGNGGSNPGWGNNELEYYTSRSQNAYASNGFLNIVARHESFSGFNYTSARMKTAGLFSQKYGRFECYASLPQGQGYWPAFWMMPQNEVYGGWAASGEIDVMENMGNNPTNVLGTIHFGGMYPNQTQSYGPSYNFAAGDSVTNFHLYGLQWSNNSISWLVDGKIYETQTSWWSSSNPTNTDIRNPYPAPFDQTFYIILNLAVGGNFGGNPDGTTVFPGQMQVDYERAYQWVTVPPPPPVLRLHVPFKDLPGSNTTVSITNEGGAAVSLQMLDGSGNPHDYHGAANSGVAAAVTGNRAMDFSSNGANQPGNPGPVAAVTNANLGFGTVSNFIVSLWFKQNAAMTAGANVGPRLFILSPPVSGGSVDTGVTNSIGMKFQMANQIYFQLGSVTASAVFSTNLPTNAWIFVAATYDGSTINFYQGTETNSVSLISSTSASGAINLGATAAMFAGNRQDRQRSFDGWLDDFRFYTGVGDSNFVESVRLLSTTLPAPPALNFQHGTNGVALVWTNGVLQSATNFSGPWSDLGAASSPFTVVPAGPQGFYRVRLQQ